MPLEISPPQQTWTLRSSGHFNGGIQPWSACLTRCKISLPTGVLKASVKSLEETTTSPSCNLVTSGFNPEVTKLHLGDVVVSSKLLTEAFKTPLGRDILHLVKHANDGWIPPLKSPEDHKVQVCCDGEILSGIKPVSAKQQNMSYFTQATAFESGGEGKILRKRSHLSGNKFYSLKNDFFSVLLRFLTRGMVA